MFASKPSITAAVAMFSKAIDMLDAVASASRAEADRLEAVINKAAEDRYAAIDEATKAEKIASNIRAIVE